MEETWTEETSSYMYGCECHLGKFFAGIQMARIDKKINTKSSLVNISKIEDGTNFNFKKLSFSVELIFILSLKKYFMFNNITLTTLATLHPFRSQVLDSARSKRTGCLCFTLLRSLLPTSSC